MKDKNYSEAQEARLTAAAADGALNAERAAELADEFGKSPRSVIAKIIRMGLAYERKEATSKDGSPVEKKGDLVVAIGKVVEGNLEGLDKAPKAALRAIRDFVAASNG